MTPAQAQAMYRRQIAQFETVGIRRYSGIGTSRSPTNWTPVRARVTEYEPKELAGQMQEGERHAIILNEDLVALSFSGDILPHDKVVWNGQEYTIRIPNGATRRIGGITVGYDLFIRG